MATRLNPLQARPLLGRFAAFALAAWATTASSMALHNSAMPAARAPASTETLVSGEPASPGRQAWTESLSSPGLHSVGQPVTVKYQPRVGVVPAGATITQVYASRDYVGEALIQTSLCTFNRQRCVDIVGRHINSHAFQGLPADQPMVLVHRADNWNGSRPPVYVKGTVTVWYAPPEIKPEARSEP